MKFNMHMQFDVFWNITQENVGLAPPSGQTEGLNSREKIVRNINRSFSGGANGGIA